MTAYDQIRFHVSEIELENKQYSNKEIHMDKLCQLIQSLSDSAAE